MKYLNLYLFLFLFSSELALSQDVLPSPKKIDENNVIGALEVKKSSTLEKTCMQANLKRVLKIQSPNVNGLPCEVHYIKENGEDKIIYNAANDATYCELKFNEMADRLAGMGWTCQ